MDLEKIVREYVAENMPTEVQVPTGVSKSEAIRQVKKQFSDAGAFDCSDGLASRIVDNAWQKAKRDASSSEQDDTDDDN
jgi:hypothetical protein